VKLLGTVALVVGLAAGLVTIFGAVAGSALFLGCVLLVIVVVLLYVSSPKFAGFILTNTTCVTFEDAGKTATTESSFQFVPLQEGISHQVWFADRDRVQNVSGKLDGSRIDVSALSADGTCIANFGSQLRRFRRYEIARTTRFKPGMFDEPEEYYYFQPRRPMFRLALEIQFPKDRLPISARRVVRLGTDGVDRGQCEISQGTVKWVKWFPSIGHQYWILWRWEPTS